MNEQNLALAQTIFQKIGEGAPPEDISQHFAEDVSMEIPGDETVMPWIGYHKGRASIEKFLTDQRTLIRSNWRRVDDMLANDTRVVVIGELSATFLEEHQTIDTFFVIILTISEGLVTRFQMFEDTFAGSRIAGVAAAK